MFGFMLPTWFLSMWVSNTATTAMMIPIVGAVLEEFKLVKKASNAGKFTWKLHVPRLNPRKRVKC